MSFNPTNFGSMDFNQMRKNPNMIVSFLSTLGINYPIHKQELVEQVRASGTDPRVVEQLERLPDDVYQDPSEIAEACANLR